MSVSDVASNAIPAANHQPSSVLNSNTRSNSRRKTVVAEKKSNSEVLSEAGVSGVINDKMVVNENAPINTIRGESVLEKLKDLSHLKGGPSTSTMSPRRRKILLMSDKPKWQIVLNVLTKNCLLLVALLWLGQMVWNRTDKTGASTQYSFSILDSEDRVFEGDSSLKEVVKKEMVKLLDVQIDMVDNIIEHKLGIVTGKLARQLEEKGAMFEEELIQLEARTDCLDKSLNELMDDFLTKEDFESYLNGDEYGNSEHLDGSDTYVSLEEVRAVATSIVDKRIEKHAADGLGTVDHALASGGGRVIRHSEPFVSGMINSLLTAVRGWNVVHADAQKVLEPSFGEPGQCFPLQGHHGFIDIRLRTDIIPEAIALEHVSKSTAYDRSSAPKNCRVFGWYEAGKEDPLTPAGKWVLLADFWYDLDKSNVQTFDVRPVSPDVINMVRFEFTTNHGNPDLTCIYRVRVHGHEPSSTVTSVQA